MLKKVFFPIHLTKSFLSHLFVSSLLLATVTSCACTDGRKPEAQKQKEDRLKEIAALETLSHTKASVEEAVAEIKSFKGNQIKGIVTFTKVSNGIRVVADVQGLAPGKHGFHVHEFGDCSGEGAAAGEHFNPTHRAHGGPDSAERHVGDLGNLIADENGHAHYERVDTLISLSGENSILGRSIIIHSDPDDYTTQPSGHSGNKIACGLITAQTDVKR